MSRLEAMAMFPALKEEDAFRVFATSMTDGTMLSGPTGSVPVDALVQAISLGRALFGVADLEPKGGVPSDVADVVFMLLDFNDDNILSPMELRALSLSEELVQSMMVKSEGSGISLESWRALQKEPITDCSRLVLIEKSGPIEINTLWLPRGRCNILLLPPFKVPAEYDTYQDSSCIADPQPSAKEFTGEHCPVWREFVYDTNCG